MFKDGKGGRKAEREAHLVFFEEAEMAALVGLRPLAVRPSLYRISHRRRHFHSFCRSLTAAAMCGVRCVVVLYGCRGSVLESPSNFAGG